MNAVTLTLTFASLDELHEYLNGGVDRQLKIDFNDRPDVGVSAAVAAPFNPFAQQEVAAVPVPPPPAPSIAVVAAPPTAPAAPPATSVTPPAVGVPPAPPPAPEAAVPAAPAAPASPAGIDVDADGLPWDARIHAGGRAQNADGRWRQKRGLNDAALKARVEAELRQAMGAPSVALGGPNAPFVPPAPIATETPAIPSPPAAPTAPDTFASLASRMGPHLMSGKLTSAALDSICVEFGLPSMALLPTRPDLVGPVGQRIDALLAA